MMRILQIGAVFLLVAVLPVGVRSEGKGMKNQGLSESAGVPRHPSWTNALTLPGKPGAPIMLAENGRTEIYIVYSAEPTTQDVKAAQDLAHWLQEMTGASFQIIQEDPAGEGRYVAPGGGSGVEVPARPKRFVSVGQTRLASRAKVGLGELAHRQDAYRIAQRKGGLYLLGGQGRGIINAVYSLLEEDLGCRWYTPGATSIPRTPTLKFRPVSRTYAPVLVDRRDPYYTEVQDLDWSLRNRTFTIGVAVPMEWGGHAKPLARFVHSFNEFIWRSEFEQHPEYFMMKDGQRNPHQLCLTNPEVRRILIETTLARLEKKPDSRIVDISPNDGGGTCACGACKAISDAEGSNMGPLLDLVNAVADAVAEDYPELRVTTLAYLDTKRPPKNLRPRDNVLIWLATDDHNWEYLLLHVWETEKFSSALKAWSKTGARVIIWDYTIDFHNYIVPLPNMPVVAPNLRYYIEHGVTGVFLQAQHHPTHGVDRSLMRSWVWAKQLWDPSRSTRQLIRDFNFGFYGAAAEPMQEYCDMLWQIWERLHADPENLRKLHKEHGPGAKAVYLTPEFGEQVRDIFARAEALAGEDTELQDRIALAKLPILYLRLEEGPGDDALDYAMLIDEFEHTAKANKVHAVKSGFRAPFRDETIQAWRQRAVPPD